MDNLYGSTYTQKVFDDLTAELLGSPSVDSFLEAAVPLVRICQDSEAALRKAWQWFTAGVGDDPSPSLEDTPAEMLYWLDGIWESSLRTHD